MPHEGDTGFDHGCDALDHQACPLDFDAVHAGLQVFNAGTDGGLVGDLMRAVRQVAIYSARCSVCAIGRK
jgi:hypothetical protein